MVQYSFQELAEAAFICPHAAHALRYEECIALPTDQAVQHTREHRRTEAGRRGAP